jgi:hypothetical protein
MTYVCPVYKFMMGINCLNFSGCKRFSAPLAIFQGAFRFEIYTGLSYCHMLPITYITKLCRQQAESYKIIEPHMFAAQHKAKPSTERERGLNLQAFGLTPFK